MRAATGLALLAALWVPLGILGCGGDDDDGPEADTAPPTVNATVPGGTYTEVQTVALAATDDRDPAPAIRYTVDGSAPTAASSSYGGPLTISTTTTLKFFAVDASGNASAVVTHVYTIGPGGGALSGTAETPSADFQEIADRLTAVLALGYNTTNADVVMKQLNDLDATKSPESLVIVDTREPADFAKGHIPGALNVPLQVLPQKLLDGTSGIPADKEVVVASYWGNDGNMASLLINCARITDPANPNSFPRSTALFQGMSSWSFDRDLVPAGTRFDDALAAGVIVQKDTETAAHAGADQGAYPNFTPFTPATDTVAKKILVRAKAYLNSVPTQFDLQLYPKALADNLADGNSANDPQIVSVRSGPDYAKGHVPGAINIPYKSVADVANFTKFVSPGKPVAVYCYTGHTGSLSTMALGILGYEVKDLLYGVNGWTTSAVAASGQLKNFDLNRGWDFPLHNWGNGIDSLATYVPTSNSCQGCHTSLTAIWRERVLNPPSASAAPPSSGEG